MVPNREWEVNMRPFNGGSYRIVQARGDYTARLGLRRFAFKVQGLEGLHSFPLSRSVGNSKVFRFPNEPLAREP